MITSAEHYYKNENFDYLFSPAASLVYLPTEKDVLRVSLSSAIALTVHSIFLGIKFDNDFYKLFRRVIMLAFIVFEIVAQAYLVATFYSLKDRLKKHINII